MADNEKKTGDEFGFEPVAEGDDFGFTPATKDPEDYDSVVRQAPIPHGAPRAARRGLNAPADYTPQVPLWQSRAAAAGIGLAQGATAGHVDEAVGLVTDDETKAQTRDAEKELAAQHPWLHGIGTATGAALALPIAAGKGLAGGLKTAAALGALQGEGYSDADPGYQLAKDTLEGAAWGVGAQFASNLVGAVGSKAKAMVNNLSKQGKLSYLSAKGFTKSQIAKVTTMMAHGKNYDDAVYQTYRSQYKNLGDLELQQHALAQAGKISGQIDQGLSSLDKAKVAGTEYFEAAERYIAKSFTKGALGSQQKITPVIKKLRSEAANLAEMGRKPSVAFDAAQGFLDEAGKVDDPTLRKAYVEAYDILMTGWEKQMGQQGAEIVKQGRARTIARDLYEGVSNKINTRASAKFGGRVKATLDEMGADTVANIRDWRAGKIEAQDSLMKLASQSDAGSSMARRALDMLQSKSIGPTKKRLLLAAIRRGPEAIAIQLSSTSHGIGYRKPQTKEEKFSPFK